MVLRNFNALAKANELSQRAATIREKLAQNKPGDYSEEDWDQELVKFALARMRALNREDEDQWSLEMMQNSIKRAYEIINAECYEQESRELRGESQLQPDAPSVSEKSESKVKANTEAFRNAITDELESETGIFTKTMNLDAKAQKKVDAVGGNEVGAGVTSNNRIKDWIWETHNLYMDSKSIGCFMKKAITEAGIPKDRSVSVRCDITLRYQVWTQEDRKCVATHIRKFGADVLKGSEKRKREAELNAAKKCKLCKNHKMCTVCDHE